MWPFSFSRPSEWISVQVSSLHAFARVTQCADWSVCLRLLFSSSSLSTTLQHEYCLRSFPHACSPASSPRWLLGCYPQTHRTHIFLFTVHYGCDHLHIISLLPGIHLSCPLYNGYLISRCALIAHVSCVSFPSGPHTHTLFHPVCGQDMCSHLFSPYNARPLIPPLLFIDPSVLFSSPLTPSQSAEEIAQYTTDESLSELDRVVNFCRSGFPVQRLSAVTLLPRLVQSYKTEAVEKCFPLMRVSVECCVCCVCPVL